jgi:predicted GNAT family acetyltransferase
MIKNNAQRGRFELEVEGGTAVLDYTIAGTKLYLTHTGVPPESRGRGVAAELTRTALEWASEKGFMVVPQCSYVVAYMEAHPKS